MTLYTYENISYINQTDILELKNATHQVKHLMDEFNFTLDTLERGCGNWNIGQKKLFRITQRDKRRENTEEVGRRHENSVRSHSKYGTGILEIREKGGKINI